MERNLLYSVFFLLLFFTSITKAQQLIEGEQEILNKANQLFSEKKYEAAAPYFSQLLSLYPKDPTYNYKYGICLVEINQKTDKALEYLQFASTKNVDFDVNFYIGKALHLNYRFEDALVYYNKFKSQGNPTQVKSFNVDKYIEMATNGKELIKYINQLKVLVNKKVKNEDFYYSYDIGEFGGRIILKPEEFKSAVDKSENEKSYMFVPNELYPGDYVYFSSYGKNKKNGKDIYRIKKLKDGVWGDLENLGPVINTPYDEDYPFMFSDGITLYFCSKGHNSMGGYDIFKTTWDYINKTWTPPVNLDFPINSPYDDILYVVDPNQEYAFFSSNRETDAENISVYKIEIEKNPIEKKLETLTEIIREAKLEVSIDAQATLAGIQDIKLTTPQYENLSTVGLQSKNYFTQLELSQTLTSETVLEEANKDAEFLENESEKNDNNSKQLLLIANNKNTEANKLREEANSLKNVLTTNEAQEQKIKQLYNQAEQLEKEAIIAYNLATTLEKSANGLREESEKTLQFANTLESQKEKGPEVLAQQLNKNRQQLTASEQKYTSIEDEVVKRKNEVANKNQELLEAMNKLNEIRDEINIINSEIQALKNKYNVTTDKTEQDKITQKLTTLKTEYTKKDNEQSKLTEEINKLKIQTKELNNELSVIEELFNNITTKPISSTLLSEETKTINKDSLIKELNNKELIADKQYIEKVEKNKKNEITISETPIQLQIQSKPEPQVTKTTKTYESLIIDATEYNSKADSLSAVVEKKRKILANTRNEEEKNILNEEIQALENQIYAYKADANDKTTQAAIEKQKQISSQAIMQTEQPQAQPIIETPKPTTQVAVEDNFPFQIAETENKEATEYQKELFKIQYYDDIEKSLNQRLKIMKNSVDTIKNQQVKQTYQNEIENYEKIISENKQKKQESTLRAAELKEKALSTIKEENLTQDQLLLAATSYKPKIQPNFTSVEQMYVEKVVVNRKSADEMLNNWDTKIKEIKDLREKIKNTDDTDKKLAFEKTLAKKTADAEADFNFFNDIYEKVNRTEYELYNEKLSQNRIIGNTEKLKQAAHLEQESKLYYEKANIIRNDAALIDDIDRKAEELKKAKNLELIAINKQKNANDLYMQARSEGIKPSDLVNKYSKNEITLQYEEEQQIKDYKTKDHYAQTLEQEAILTLKRIADKVEQAGLTNDPKEKKKLLAGTDKIKKQAMQQLIESYELFRQADSLKFALYDKQFNELQKSLPEVENNTLVAKQYLYEADFYYDAAIKLRQKAKDAEDIDLKIDYLAKATDFEKKALTSQEIAFDILMDQNAIDFCVVNELVKVDKLEKANTPVNTSAVEKSEEEIIFSTIKLSDIAKENLNKSKQELEQADNLINQSDELLKKAKDLREIAKEAEDSKIKEKSLKQAKKYEDKAIANQLSAAQLRENANEKKYYINVDNFNKIRMQGNGLEARKGKQLEKEATDLYFSAKQLRDKATWDIDDDRKALEMFNKAYKLEQEALEKQNKAYSIYLELQTPKVTEEFSEAIKKNIVDLKSADLSPLPKDTTVGTSLAERKITPKTEQPVAIQPKEIKPTEQPVLVQTTESKTIEQPTIPKKEAITTTPTASITKTTLSSNTATSTKSTTTTSSDFIYKFSSDITYSDNNPIPINEPLPNGFVFKVQIGAFYAPVKNNTFKGLYPVVGEKEEGSKFYKYVVGRFRSYEVAILAREELKSKGYEDAFIVAYLNGKRIPVFEARNMIKSGAKEVPANYADIAKSEASLFASKTSTPITTPQVTNTEQSIETPTKTSIQSSLVETAPDIKNKTGLLYTVQIGVFKQAINSNDLFNIAPIYKEVTPYGFTRYFTGLFDDYSQATIEKDRLVRIGIADAFVTAYYQGKRISIEEAKNIEQTKGKGAFETKESITVPTTIKEKQPVVLTNANIIFKVQLGMFRGNVPSDKQELFLTAASKWGLDQVPLTNGYTIYSTGNFKNYDDALKLKQEIVEIGLTDAFIVAYNGNEKISIDDALRYLKQK